MTRRTLPRQIAAALLRIAAGLAAIIGVPIALALLFGWPLPTRMPDWESVSSTPLRFVDPVVILNLFVCLVWISWAVLTTYSVLGIADAARGLPRRSHRITPLATLAAKFTASVLLLGTLTRPATVAALPAAPAVTVASVEMGEASSVQIARPAPTQPMSTIGPPNPAYVVQRGDTLWDIAEDQLGDPFRWTEIRDLNPDVITDPGLIRTGWNLILPATSHIAAPSTQPTAETAPPPAPAQPSPAPAPVAPPAVSPLTQLAEILASDPDSEVSASASETSRIGVLLGVTGATALATGLAVALRRRQRSRSSGPLRVIPATDVERHLVAASDLPLVRWVGQTLAELGELIAGRPDLGVPLAVEFSEASGLELLWDQPADRPPRGWSAEPGGWSWHYHYDPEATVPAAALPALLPALVTIGHRDDKQLMINLEALGAVTIDGDRSASQALVRSMVLELSTGDEIASAQTLAIDHLESLRLPSTFEVPHAGVDEAIEALRTAQADAAELLARVGCATTFAYRTFSVPILPVDVTVAVGDAADPHLDDAAGALLGHHATALVLLGATDATSNRITVESDGSATLEPLGIAFAAAALPVETVDAVAELFDDHHPPSHAARDDRPRDGGVVQPWWLEDSSGLDPDDSDVIDLTDVDEENADRWSGSASRMMVKVLGAPRLVDGPELGRRELVVVALVACSSRPVTHEHVQDAIWGSRPISTKSVFNLIGATRTALGAWDGELVLSSATRPANTIHLHRDVGTDLAMMRSLVAEAQRSNSTTATNLLHQALELVEGRPFDGPGYDWAITEQLVSEAEQLTEHAASLAAQLALEAGDLSEARWVIAQGLRALPGDESLYRLRMRTEDAAGNRAGVRRTFEELEMHLDEFSLSPSAETRELLQELMATSPPPASHSHATGAQ